MRFKEWLVLEMGHGTVMHPPGLNFYALQHQRPIFFRHVKGIDPRFEFQNIPNQDPRINSRKFMGTSTYSLPLINRKGQQKLWIVSDRVPKMEPISGSLRISVEPEGVLCPLNWADFAVIDGDNQNMSIVGVHQPADVPVLNRK